MKYCKKCLRNVREEVSVCPYCGAPGLEEYGSSRFGDDFSCTKPKDLEREIDEEVKSLNKSNDIYDEREDEPESDEEAYGSKTDRDNCNDVEEDAYGSKRHNDSNCDNAPDTPSDTGFGGAAIGGAALGSGFDGSSNNSGSFGSLSSEPDLDPKSPQYAMRIQYLNTLRKIDGISQERIDELMERYDEAHGNNTGKSPVYSTRPKIYGDTNTTRPGDMPAVGDSALPVAIVFGVIGIFQPIFGIIAMAIFKKIAPADSKTYKTANIFLAISIIVLIGTMVGAIIGSSVFEGLLNG